MNNKNSGSSTKSTPTMKKSLPPPPTFAEFGVALVLYFCRKYVLFNVEMKVIIYIVFVVCGSFFGELVPLTRGGYLSQKGNILNVVFVKWCWAWTLLIIGSFVYYTSMVYSAGDRRNLRQQIARLIVGTFVWFFSTRFFVRVAAATGYCRKNANATNEISCTLNGGRWYELDISGHVFMLVYICLLFTEELRVFRNWDRIKVLVDSCTGDRNDDPPELMLLNRSEIEQVRRAYIEYTPKIRILFVLSTLLNFIWEVMIVISTLYFHNPTEKIVAVGLAVFFWWITYRVWFRSQMSPGMPGHCKVKYVKPSTVR